MEGVSTLLSVQMEETSEAPGRMVVPSVWAFAVLVWMLAVSVWVLVGV